MRPRPATAHPWPPDPRLVEFLLLAICLAAAKLVGYLPLPAVAVAGFLAPYGAVLLRRPGDRRVRLACFAAALLLIGVLPATTFMRATWHGIDERAHDGGVLVTDAAVRALLHGQDPYTVSYAPELADWPIGVQGHSHPNPMQPHFPYWPGSLAAQLPVQAPLVALGLRVDARYLYLAVYLVMGVGLARWSLRTRGDLLLAVPCCLDPVLLSHLWWGANEVLLLAGLAGTAWALASRRPTTAGLLLGATLSVKQTFAPLVALFAVWLWAEARAGRLPGRRAWRAAGAALAVPLATGLPFLLWHPGALLDDAVAYPLGLGAHPYPIAGTSLPGLLLHAGVLRDPFGRLPLWSALLPVAALLACAGWVWRRPSPRTLLLAGGATVLASLFLHRWLYPYYLASPIAILALGLLVRWPAPEAEPESAAPPARQLVAAAPLSP